MEEKEVFSNEKISKFLDAHAKLWNVQRDKLEESFKLAIEEMKSCFPGQPENVIKEKATFKLKVDYKSKQNALVNHTPFNGIIICEENARDPFIRIRNEQLAIYMKANELYIKNGDRQPVQQVFDNKIVEKDTEGHINPLWPKLKANGKPSKVAGKPMPSVESSMIKTVYGIGTPVGKKDAKGFKLELRGNITNIEILKGKVMNFHAMEKDSVLPNMYELSTGKTEFNETEDEYLQEGIDELGIVGMVESMFKDHIVDWKTVNSWIEKKIGNPKSEPIPDQYRNMTILTESLCVFQNFSPDQKERIKMILCEATASVNENLVWCLADKSLDKSIDFAHNSKVIAIGRPWLPTPEEGKETNMMLFTSGMFAYKDYKFPRIEAEKLDEGKIMQTEFNAENTTESNTVHSQPESTEPKEETKEVPW